MSAELSDPRRSVSVPPTVFPRASPCSIPGKASTSWLFCRLTPMSCTSYLLLPSLTKANYYALCLCTARIFGHRTCFAQRQKLGALGPSGLRQATFPASFLRANPSPPSGLIFMAGGLPATHAAGHLEVTTIVVVVIDIYLYYYSFNGHSEMIDGPLPCCQSKRAWPVPAPFVPFPGAPEPFLAVLSLEGPRLPVSPGRRPFGRCLGKCNGPADGWRNRTVLPC